MSYQHASLSDIGRVRPRNEDSMIADQEHGLFGVADGVGGLPHGDLASGQTLRWILELLPCSPPVASLQQLKAATTEVNTRIHAEGMRLNPPLGIGTTLTIGVLDGMKLSLVHAGDSRCYIWRGGRITQATMDHTVESDVEFAKRHRWHTEYMERQKGALTRCIGQFETINLETHEIELQEDDRVLFCTDGLYRKLHDDELTLELTKAREPAKALSRLVQLANLYGGEDNCTGVLLFM